MFELQLRNFPVFVLQSETYWRWIIKNLGEFVKFIILGVKHAKDCLNFVDHDSYYRFSFIHFTWHNCILKNRYRSMWDGLSFSLWLDAEYFLTVV